MERPTPISHFIPVLLACGLLLVLSGCGKSVEPAREEILAAFPEAPDSSGLTRELANAFAGAYKQIETGENPVAGLARLTRIYQANGYLNDAIKGEDLLLRLDPENPLWPHLLAFNLAGYGQLEPAIELWEKVMELAPDYLPAHLRRAEALLKLNRLDDARDAYLVVLIKDPDNAHANHGLARIEIDHGDYESALPYLQKSMATSKGTIGIQLMVTVLDRIGQSEKADSIRAMARTLEGHTDIIDPWFDSLIDYCYDPYQLVTAAGTKVFAGDVEGGIAIMNRALSYDPDYASAYHQLGIIYRDAGRPQEALPNFARAAELNPKLPDAWLFQALIYLDRGMTEEGEKLLTLGLAHNPASPSLHRVWGEQLMKKGRIDDAEKEFKRSIELRPQEPEPYLALARIYMDQDKLEEAREKVLESLNAEAGNPMGLTMMVVLNINLGDEEKALEWLRRVDLQPRITDDVRGQLVGFFERAFGHKPPRNP